jgi:hypothetical protein
LYIAEHKDLAKKLNSPRSTADGRPRRTGRHVRFSDGHTTVRKTFRFQKDSYLAQVTSEVKTDGQPVDNALEWRGGFGDFTMANPARQAADHLFRSPPTA